MGAHRPGGPPEGGPRLRTSPSVGRVYGRRRGRRLTGQKAELLDNRLDALLVRVPEPPAPLDPAALFDAVPLAVWLEIGFGGGEHLAAQAAAHPDIGFIGCEPFLNGVSNLLLLIETGGLRNVRILTEDARLLLAALPEASIGRQFLLFPDPWPKRRHEGRRFLARATLDLLARALADDGELRMATDHAGLGPWIEQQMESHRAFRLQCRAQTRPEDWPSTRYEEKARRAGREALYLSYARTKRQVPAG
jgi:tRNA (guanine-N7-)-methyltransferase